MNTSTYSLYESIYKNYPLGIIEIDSGKPGYTFSLIACTHGNEPVGLHVQKFLLEEYKIGEKLSSGKIQLIVGNIDAIKHDTRFVDYDMNRVWDFNKKHEKTSEYKRALKIAPYIEKSDIIFDIHSTQAPSDPFFLAMNNVPCEFSTLINCEYIIENFPSFVRGRLLTDYNREAINFVLEAGVHKSKDTLELSIENTLIALRYFGMISENVKLKKYNAPCYKQEDVINAQTMQVQYLYTHDTPQSFDYVKKGTPILQDGENVIIKDKDYYLLMPCLPHCIGDEMCHLVTKA